jgi:hypothetical protein
MDEIVEITSDAFLWPSESITEQCILYRHAHFSKLSKNPEKRRFPNESHFTLREGEDGLSFNWGKYADEQRGFIVLGLTHRHDGDFMKIGDYTFFKYPKKVLKEIPGIQEIIHHPTFNGNPSDVGKPNNKSHSLVIYDKDDLSVRMDLSDYCNRIKDSKCDVEIKLLDQELNALRERLNNTEYHRLWNFRHQ